MKAFAELNPPDWRRLNRLLEQALELEADARVAWLDQLAASDKE